MLNIYGKKVTIDAFIDVLIPSRTLGDEPILVVIFPQRGGKKMNIFFSTDITPISAVIADSDARSSGARGA